MMETERLLLRPWCTQDYEPFARMNADPRVREFYPALLTREESDASIDRFQQSQTQNGFCFWAAELRYNPGLIGFVGLQRMTFVLPNASDPAVEIGWRLTPESWGQGLATEGARAAMQFALEKLHLPEVVAITVPTNARSRRVMEKLGMRHNPEDDFDNPRVAAGHPLRPHVLYRMKRSWWSSVQEAVD